MRTSKLVSLLLAAIALACSGPEPSPTESRPEFAAACTAPGVSTNPKFVSQPAQANRQVIFTVSAACGAGAAGTWELFANRTGAVSTITGLSVGTVTLTAGQSKPVTVTYTTGSAGSGTVVLEAFIENPPAPLRKSSGTLIVSVTASSGIPYGPWGFNVDTLRPGSIWTGTGRGAPNPNTVLILLDAASRRSVGIWFNLVGADELYRNNDADGSFNLQAWKADFDSKAGSINSDGTSSFYQRYLPYIKSGTYQGTMLIDDIAIFNQGAGPTFAQIEAMATHSKLRFPTLPTAVRAAPTKLKEISRGAKYTQLDAGWAQYRPTRGPVVAYRDSNIQAAKDVALGLVTGINIRHAMADRSQAPTESILAWGRELLKAEASDYVCGFFMWDDAYVSLTDPVFATLATLAKNHVKAPCKRRP